MIKINDLVIAIHETEFRVLDADCRGEFDADTLEEAQWIARGLGGVAQQREVYATEWADVRAA